MPRSIDHDHVDAIGSHGTSVALVATVAHVVDPSTTASAASPSSSCTATNVSTNGPGASACPSASIAAAIVVTVPPPAGVASPSTPELADARATTPRTTRDRRPNDGRQARLAQAADRLGQGCVDVVVLEIDHARTVRPCAGDSAT